MKASDPAKPLLRMLVMTFCACRSWPTKSPSHWSSHSASFIFYPARTDLACLDHVQQILSLELFSSLPLQLIIWLAADWLLPLLLLPVLLCRWSRRLAPISWAMARAW